MRHLLTGLVAWGLTATSASAGGFQAACERLVGNRAATVVAVEPMSGQLRALVHPDLAGRPVPPGSTFKLVTALAGMERGCASTRTCRGWMQAPGEGGRPETMRCWKPDGHGPLELEGALAASCNLHFVALGRAVGAPALAQTAKRCGLGVNAAADPRDARTAIGEGQRFTMTAMQAAALVSAIATDGALKPVSWRPVVWRALPLARPVHLARLRAGMRGAVRTGSAKRAAVAGLEVAGKTGTATYLDGSNRTWGWFVGYATAGGRHLAVAVRADNANGFIDAAGLAGSVFRAWRDAGMP